jgi:hypothetical protein
VVTEHSRAIFRIGSERYAFDFTSTVTQLPPEPAPVISFEEKRKPRGESPGLRLMLHSRTSVPAARPARRLVAERKPLHRKKPPEWSGGLRGFKADGVRF